jgi:hypothetical protein
MRSIGGRASSTVRTAAADRFPLLAAVDRYPEWTGDVVRDVTSPRHGTPADSCRA